jgi:hypothetical protein
MTFPAITRNVESKAKGEERLPNYSGAVRFLNKLQYDNSKRRLRSSSARITLIFMLILAIISVCVVIASALR